jgi:thiopeptide-type bacteriocin biosynthesis protein
MLIDKIIIDTYNREIERYGGELIENSETIFHNDCLAVLRFIDLLEGSEGEKYRMLFSLRAINMFLDDFDLPLSEKISFSKYIQESFFIEFGGSPQLQKLVNERYRKYQKDIFSHMDEKNDIVNEIYEGINIFKIRGESNKSVSLAIREKFIGDVNNDELFKLLSSYIHMFMNRLFIGNQRKYELLLYHFLNKYYNSIKAISVNELDK